MMWAGGHRGRLDQTRECPAVAGGRRAEWQGPVRSLSVASGSPCSVLAVAGHNTSFRPTLKPHKRAAAEVVRTLWCKSRT
eukprot:1143899-Prymnesium_polylepis.1